MADLREALGTSKESARREVAAIFKANPGLRQRFSDLGLDEGAIEAAIVPSLTMLANRFPWKVFRQMVNSLDGEILDAINRIEKAIKDGDLKGGTRQVDAWKRRLSDPFRHVPPREKRGTQPHTVFETELRRRGIGQGLAREIVTTWVRLKDTEVFGTKDRKKKPMSYARASLAYAREQRAYFRALRDPR